MPAVSLFNPLAREEYEHVLTNLLSEEKRTVKRLGKEYLWECLQDGENGSMWYEDALLLGFYGVRNKYGISDITIIGNKHMFKYPIAWVKACRHIMDNTKYPAIGSFFEDSERGINVDTRLLGIKEVTWQ